MLKIDAILQGLDEVDQSAVAFEVYRTYFTQEGVHKESTKLGGVREVNGQLQQYVVPVVASSNRQLSEEAREALNFLNEKTGKSYRAVETNLVLIRNCLKSGATLTECKGVIARKVRQWKGTEMEKYLRPATLFNRTKFEQYLGERDAVPANA